MTTKPTTTTMPDTNKHQVMDSGMVRNQRCTNLKALHFDIHLDLDKVIGNGRIMFPLPETLQLGEFGKRENRQIEIKVPGYDWVVRDSIRAIAKIGEYMKRASSEFRIARQVYDYRQMLRRTCSRQE